jgi:valyl-tRNA synthetase
MLLSTPGLVLHTTPYSESSVVVKVFTRQLGVRSYIIKGVRGRGGRVKRKLGDQSGANVAKSDVEKPAGALSFMVGTMECFVPMPENVNKDEELKKLQDELKYAEGFLRSVMGKLSNEKFVNGAPAAVIEKERNKQRDAETKIAALKAQIASLS